MASPLRLEGEVQDLVPRRHLRRFHPQLVLGLQEAKRAEIIAPGLRKSHKNRWLLHSKGSKQRNEESPQVASSKDKQSRTRIERTGAAAHVLTATRQTSSCSVFANCPNGSSLLVHALDQMSRHVDAYVMVAGTS